MNFFNQKAHFIHVGDNQKEQRKWESICSIAKLLPEEAVSRKETQIGKRIRINQSVFSFLDNQQEQGVRVGVHQGSAGCLVRMGGDAAHRPAGGYVEGCASRLGPCSESGVFLVGPTQGI